MTTTIDIKRNGQDAAKLAAETAREHGTKLNGNLRWTSTGSVRSVPTRDGRTIRITEY